VNKYHLRIHISNCARNKLPLWFQEKHAITNVSANTKLKLQKNTIRIRIIN